MARAGPADRLGQVALLDDQALADDDGALDRVLELADVAGPGVPAEDIERAARDSPRLAPVLARVLLDEVLGQGRDVARGGREAGAA